jgi:hypothetical protein
LRSTTVTSWRGSSFFISSPKYRPAGPPPMQTIFMRTDLGELRDGVAPGGAKGKSS